MISKQIISLSLEHGKRNKGVTDLKNTSLEKKKNTAWNATCEYHIQFSKKRIKESCANYRVVAESGIKALNVGHIFQLGWEFDQKGGIVKNKQQTPKKGHLC